MDAAAQAVTSRLTPAGPASASLLPFLPAAAGENQAQRDGQRRNRYRLAPAGRCLPGLGALPTGLDIIHDFVHAWCLGTETSLWEPLEWPVAG